MAAQDKYIIRRKRMTDDPGKTHVLRLIHKQRDILFGKPKVPEAAVAWAEIEKEARKCGFLSPERDLTFLRNSKLSVLKCRAQDKLDKIRSWTVGTRVIRLSEDDRLILEIAGEDVNAEVQKYAAKLANVKGTQYHKETNKPNRKTQLVDGRIRQQCQPIFHTINHTAPQGMDSVDANGIGLILDVQLEHQELQNSRIEEIEALGHEIVLALYDM